MLTLGTPCSLRFLSLIRLSENSGDRTTIFILYSLTSPSSQNAVFEVGEWITGLLNPPSPPHTPSHTSLHQCLPLVDVVCRKVVLSDELLVADEGGQPGAEAKQRGQTHEDYDDGIVDVEVASEPGNQGRVSCSLRQ